MTKHTTDDILDALPSPPDGYNYTVERVSPLVTKVWLVNHYDFVYTEGRKSRTVYCFIKGDKCYPAKNAKAARPKSTCKLGDLHKQSPFTLIKPDITTLHLFL